MEEQFYVVTLEDGDKTVSCNVPSLDPGEFQELLRNAKFKKGEEVVRLKKGAVKKMVRLFSVAVMKGNFKLIGSAVLSARGKEV